MWKWFFGSPASGVDYSKYEAVVERNYALLAELNTAQNVVERLTTENNDLCEALSQSDFNCTEANARQANAEAACDNAYKQLAEAKRALIDMEEDLKAAKEQAASWKLSAEKIQFHELENQQKLSLEIENSSRISAECNRLRESERKAWDASLEATIRRLLKWHRERFPNATDTDVAKKLGEEVAELMIAVCDNFVPYTHYEAADVCFAAWALMDVQSDSREYDDNDTAATLAGNILDKLKQLEERPFPTPTAVS